MAQNRPAREIARTAETCTIASVARRKSGLVLTAGLLALLALGTAIALASIRHAAKAHTANSSGLAVTFAFNQTDPGTMHGSGPITGVKGHGTFSANVHGHPAADLALIAAVTKIPFTKIAKGGTFGANLTLGATGTNTGTVVAKFTAKGLGSLCFSLTAKGGKFKPGDSFVPTSGTLKVLGGTGAAARWTGGGSFTLTSIAGASTQKYSFSGSAHGSIGTARKLNSSCKQVAALVHG
jgi:hypothetical protein